MTLGGNIDVACDVTETLKGSTKGRTKRIVAIAAIMSIHLSSAESSGPLVPAVSNIGVGDNLSSMRGGGGDLFAQGQKARVTLMWIFRLLGRGFSSKCEHQSVQVCTVGSAHLAGR